MICSICKKGETSVVDSRPTEDGTAIRRRRLCVCGARFTTFEVADLALPKIIKNDGKRQEFNGSKLKKGMLRALEKRPLSAEKTDALFSKILSDIRVLGEREIHSEKIGEIMMNALKDVDQVAYVRFASVYRDFQDISDFSDEIKSLSKEDKKKSKKK